MTQAHQIHTLNSLKSELIHFQSNDLLVNIHTKNYGWKHVELPLNSTTIFVPFDNGWEKLYKRFFAIYKETGIQTACLVTKTITWIYNEKEIESPFILLPLDVVHNRNKNQLEFSYNSENAFVNPFIEKQFREQFSLDVNIENSDQKENVLLENPFVKSLQECAIIGQFHYYRFLFLKEIEDLEKGKKNAILKQLLGENSEIIPIEYTPSNILESDPTQQSILKEVGKSSFIIQGPPGTGKSQVLINIIGKLLRKDGFYAVVSEKKAAIEVIKKKLNSFQLADYTLFLDDQTQRKEVYEQLQKTWRNLEQLSVNEKHYFSITDLKKQQLQLILNRLQMESLSSGISFWELIQLSTEENKNLQPDTYHSVSISEWKKNQTIWKEIYHFPFEIWHSFSFQFWKKEQFVDFLKWAEKYEKYATIFPIQTLAGITQLNHWCVIAQMRTTDNFTVLLEIVRSKTAWRQIQKLKKRYAFLQIEAESVAKQMQEWKQIPSLKQIEQWKAQEFKFFGKRKVNKLVARNVSAVMTLDEMQALVTKSDNIHEELKNCRQQLVEMNIYAPEQDFILLETLHQRYQSVEENAWKTFDQLSPKQVAYLQENWKDVLDFSAKKWIEPRSSIAIPDLIQQVQKNEVLLQKTSKIIQSLPEAVYYWMQRKNSWKEIESQLICNEWTKFTQLFPELASLSLENIRVFLKDIIHLEAEDREQFVREIYQFRKSMFEEYHTLLLTKTTKLTEEQKEFRQQLKRGKSLLVKELTKTKQHLPLRDLMQSDAKWWVQCLCPIWLMTPTQVAKHFPMQNDIFQLTLIDEVSQIPASHIVGTLGRSKQVILAGDSQQMAPSNFFQSEEKMDILSWAQYYFKNHHLRYHYRSQHPNLIAFSNRYFYDNELEVFPVYAKDMQPIEWIYLPNGRYVDQKNELEAQEIARQIQKYIKSDKSLGIVAFSETQLQTIWQKLEPLTQQLLAERIENETAFFRALDKVQGDECDVLLVSFGYGKEENEEFKLHLGPIIKQGGEKRLNVLFSRAKEKIIFYSSVKASDFPISDNERIQLLKNYFILLEQVTQNKEEANKPDLTDWLKTIKTVDELVSKYSIWTQRGWEI